MDTRWFITLYLLCLASMLGARFALAAIEGPPPPSESPSKEAVVMAPPKPAGAVPSPAANAPGEGSGALLTRERCESSGPELRDVCFHQLAYQGGARDPMGSLPICDLIVDEETRLECRSDIAELSAPVDREVAATICAGLESVKWRGQCHFGIGLALAETDPEYALAQCEKAEVFRDFCRHDVVGEVALEDLAPAVAFCAREEGDTLTRKTCWHGIGKYLARRSFDEAVAACGQSTLEWRANCFHGLGWGAAERDPDATLVACDRQGIYRDNCRQGVAHQLKRADPSRAVSVCESIVDAGVRQRCLNFVTR